MVWIEVTERSPKPFARVWVLTDTGRETTGYVNRSGEWVINCKRIRDSGAKVERWRE
ncbi:hypothetical protein [Obesumbacterium proteus]|uniref:50S ribosomal protein L13 n=1 Tax=Obesumbacterium proteus ATCC 12841 TaxID=1354268 RepID=A0AA91EKN8_9GAMM|nr:hypothetical protein [Obesumbacterium proteus]AMO81116.1 50S ribosomal protein L13 [Obesumbacterium proteus]OAT60785.1 hypothetical protein M993_00459 [Obesumbacterium proteus ATCC 12841]